MQMPKRIPIDAYFQALEMAAMPVILWSEDGILYANRKVSRLTAYDKEELLQMHISDLIAVESFEEYQQTIELLMGAEPGSCSVIEVIVRAKTGEKLEVELSEAVTTTVSGSSIISTIMHDRNGVRQKLQDHQERLKAINQRVTMELAHAPSTL